MMLGKAIYIGKNKTKRRCSGSINYLEDIERNGYNGIGKPEPLKHEWQGYWSVRIDGANRIVFCITDEILEIAQCGSHYGNK